MTEILVIESGAKVPVQSIIRTWLEMGPNGFELWARVDRPVKVSEDEDHWRMATGQVKVASFPTDRAYAAAYALQALDQLIRSARGRERRWRITSEGRLVEETAGVGEEAAGHADRGA